LLVMVCFFYSDRRVIRLPVRGSGKPYSLSFHLKQPTTVLSVVFSFITSSNMSKNVFKLRAESLKLKAFKGFVLFAFCFSLKRGE